MGLSEKIVRKCVENSVASNFLTLGLRKMKFISYRQMSSKTLIPSIFSLSAYSLTAACRCSSQATMTKVSTHSGLRRRREYKIFPNNTPCPVSMH